MLSAFANTFKIPELRVRILFTFALLFVCRIVANVPCPGVNAAALSAAIERSASKVGGGFLGLFDMFSGGALGNFAVGALGIMPYISASIILQLMTAVIPALERLAREGESGRQKINQYTRYLTLLLCVIQGLTIATLMERWRELGLDSQVVLTPGIPFRIVAVITMTTGTMLLMWLGEQITDRGIGQGISLIITINIVSRAPAAVQMTMLLVGKLFNVFHVVLLVGMLFLVIAGTVALTQGQRKIPIQYAKRVVGRKVYGGQNTYFPLRVNYSGVMPIIFASAILMFPSKILDLMPQHFFKSLAGKLEPGSPLNLALFGIMILFFSYFWVATQFNPIQIADDLKKYGGYVPGIRPGRPTAEFLDRTMTRLTLAGAIFLTVIAVIPSVMARWVGVPGLVSQFFGGTSMLIIVGVILDTMRQVESHLVMRHYDGFLRKGKLRSRR
ncbi:MAG: preprotein translocase subunit SecY [Kiritimatiellae bacterium]|nr:preprotein translocase subunit SecY [Kiritimatiellia bacterium]